MAAFASKIDLVNSGSYFTELLVVVFGITILAGFGGSFFITGCTFGFMETRDLGSTPPFLTGAGGSAFATGAGAGLAGAFGAGLGAGFAAFGLGAFATGLAAFLGAGLTAFLGAGLGADFFTVFFAAGLAAGFFLGAGLAAFLGACFFLVAI
ncbi:MAG: hypothetical protein U0U70_03700 [Chitinophagaceae bacterium]